MKKHLLFVLPLLCLPGALHAQQAPMHKGIVAALDAIKTFDKQAWHKDSASNKPLRSATESDYLAKHVVYKKIAADLAKINPKSLSFDDEINLALLQHEVRGEVAEYQFKEYLNPILSDAGFHTSLAGRANTVISSAKDAEQYLKVLRDVPRYVDEHLQLMRKGLALGISQPKAILTGYENTYTQHIVGQPEQSVFWKPLAVKPAAISTADWAAFQATAASIIQQDVVGSYRKINTFFDQEYLPKARVTLGAAAFPDGKAYYEDRVRHYTTTALASEEVYQIGLKEVARIRAEMDKVIQQVQFKGDFKAFVTELRNDKKFQPTSAEQLLKEAAYIAKKSEGKLPALFGKLPRQPFTVAPVPAYLAPTYTSGRYSQAPIASKRAGEYWVNTYNLPNRTLYTLESLTLHEAVPGHHLQIALTQELTTLPPFRRSLYINAFGEGWGLYCEYLGHEMGFYQDPYSLFGRLTYDMWRACRLVIDVGIHAKGWTRQQAVDYLAANTALSLHEVNTEINRYISWPGQALSYKMGELKIKEMRKKAEDALQADFDVRAFHDMVLSNGTVTLAILEKMTDRFIAEQQELAKKKKT
ncbi:MAG TPA: DUF885 domain-containing protein [Hymenobacter sp.]|jgi:uncharacterized protein (DUF885 family)|uniref:DUF885 domain-containing protein n=1 Tax=Hymenobacter sp. TaxID=1898978 RepID=UPI002ED82758